MATQVTNHKCPACTGPLHFESTTGKLECEYCGSAYDVAEIEAMYAEKEQQAEEVFNKQEAKNAQNQVNEQNASEWDTSDMNSDWGNDFNNMKSYSCPSCGAELICDATTAATSCPYCGNPTVVPGQFSGALKPEFVIPFKMNKEAAVNALKKHYKSKFLLPKVFKDNNHIEEIKGIYVPFWLFDGKGNADIMFKATKVRHYRSGDYEITETNHYNVRRAGELAFDKIPADGSSKMPDNLMDSIEPFDYRELKPFSTAYLPGFLADKYDVTAQQCQPRIDKRCANTLIQAMKDTISGYTTCTVSNQIINLQKGKVHYALMPVWMLSTKWNDKNFLFAMNGQSGKLVGDLPISWGKFWGLFAGISVPLAIIIAIIMFFL